MGIEEVAIAPRIPWQLPLVERLVGTASSSQGFPSRLDRGLRGYRVGRPIVHRGLAVLVVGHGYRAPGVERVSGGVGDLAVDRIDSALPLPSRSARSWIDAGPSGTMSGFFPATGSSEVNWVITPWASMSMAPSQASTTPAHSESEGPCQKLIRRHRESFRGRCDLGDDFDGGVDRLVGE